MSGPASWLGGRHQASYNVLFQQTSDATIANTVTETTIVDGGEGSLVLPANFFRVGTSLYFRVSGVYSSSGNPTITARIKLGATTLATITGTSGNGTDDNFVIDGQITCRSIGASGSVFAQSFLQQLASGALIKGSQSTSAVTIDTTASKTLNITWEWGTASAGNTITSTNFTLHCMNR